MTTRLPDPNDPSHPARAHLGLIQHVLGMCAVGVGWWVVHRHDLWRPLTRGFVTDGFTEALWVIELSLRVSFVGHALLVLARPAWARRLFALVEAILAVATVAVFLAVFPFDPARLHPQLDVPLRLGLVALGILTSIGTASRAGALLFPPDPPEGGTA